MADSLVDEIITIIKSEANNNPAPERCEIVKVYPDKVHADVQTNNGLLKYVDCIGSHPLLGDNALIIYLSEDYSDYVVISDTEGGGSGAGVVMVGSFRINDEGHLIVTLPTGTLNPYHIDENGHLIYSTNPQIGGK